MLRRNMKIYEIIIAACIALFALTSCKSVQTNKSEQVYIRDTVHTVSVLRDSIYTCDSVFVNQYVKGDTVYRDRERWRVMYRDREKVDTLVQVRDSIVYRDVEVVKEKKPPIVFSYIKGIFIGACGVLLFSFILGITKQKQ